MTAAMGTGTPIIQINSSRIMNWRYSDWRISAPFSKGEGVMFISKLEIEHPDQDDDDQGHTHEPKKTSAQHVTFLR